jgi:hypothetical protein
VKRKSRPKRPPLGSVWRIAARGGGEEDIVAHSADWPGLVAGKADTRTIFDELVIHGVLHVEQMSSNHWWINAGDLHVDVVIKKGKPVVSWREDKTR